MLKFQIIANKERVPTEGLNTVYLWVDNWDDYRFKTKFSVTVFDEAGKKHELGSVKIGFAGQIGQETTHSYLRSSLLRLGSLDQLPENYFSVGQDVDYYGKLYEEFSQDFRNAYLTQINDVAYDDQKLNAASEERVFRVSLLRSVNLQTIKRQYRDVLAGKAQRTNFDFQFVRPESEKMGEISIRFQVRANSMPSTNIHTIIGRNGVGKTTLLNGMVDAFNDSNGNLGAFHQITRPSLHDVEKPIEEGYFSQLVAISFSVFDPFQPPPNNDKWQYIGLKNSHGGTNDLDALHSEFFEALEFCLSDANKMGRLISAIKTLQSDDNFSQMQLIERIDYFRAGMFSEGMSTDKSKAPLEKAVKENMSSGHQIVFLIIVHLVARVEERTLVIIDEPESHLHPPLLSAFTRALSDLLHNRNGVAIVATHSPVIAQEVPRSCVNILSRSGLVSKVDKPEIETFAENVGVLTREIFRLEVTKSGFHTLLKEAVNKGDDYEKILEEFGNAIGFEGRAILRSMLANRDRATSDD